MQPYEHLLVLLSIIVGLGIAELLSSVHHLLDPRARVRWHWLPLIWAVLVLMNIVHWWWAMFDLARTEAPPNYFGLLLILLSPITLYLTATTVLPRLEPGDEVDLERFYISNRRRLFGLVTLYVLLAWIPSVLGGRAEPLGQHVMRTASVAAFLILMRTANLRVHKLITGAAAGIFVCFVGLYWLRIA